MTRATQDSGDSVTMDSLLQKSSVGFPMGYEISVTKKGSPPQASTGAASLVMINECYNCRRIHGLCLSALQVPSSKELGWSDETCEVQPSKPSQLTEDLRAQTVGFWVNMRQILIKKANKKDHQWALLSFSEYKSLKSRRDECPITTHLGSIKGHSSEEFAALEKVLHYCTL